MVLAANTVMKGRQQYFDVFCSLNVKFEWLAFVAR